MFNDKWVTLRCPLLDGRQGKTLDTAIEVVMHTVRKMQGDIVEQGDCCREECTSTPMEMKAHMNDRKATIYHKMNGKVKGTCPPENLISRKDKRSYHQANTSTTRKGEYFLPFGKPNWQEEQKVLPRDEHSYSRERAYILPSNKPNW